MKKGGRLSFSSGGTWDGSWCRRQILPAAGAGTFASSLGPCEATTYMQIAIQ